MMNTDISGNDISGGDDIVITPGEDTPIPTLETVQVVTASPEVVTLLQECHYTLVAILIGIGLLAGMVFALGFFQKNG